MNYRVNDFFCGAGGVGVGYKNAGFDVVWACDFDKYAVETYRKNVGSHVVQADIKKLNWNDVPAADVWAFGFPCQDLSIAGNKRGFCFKCEDCGEEFSLDIAEYAASFDQEEHIEMWSSARRSGVRGVPTAKELVKDAEDIDAMLKELAAALSKAELETEVA